MIGGPGLTEVEKPFLNQLAGLGRETLAVGANGPSHGQVDRSASCDAGAAPARTRSIWNGGRP